MPRYRCKPCDQTFGKLEQKKAHWLDQHGRALTTFTCVLCPLRHGKPREYEEGPNYGYAKHLKTKHGRERREYKIHPDAQAANQARYTRMAQDARMVRMERAVARGIDTNGEEWEDELRRQEDRDRKNKAKAAPDRLPGVIVVAPDGVASFAE